jgi:hypothetical protein
MAIIEVAPDRVQTLRTLMLERLHEIENIVGLSARSTERLRRDPAPP